MIAKIKITIVPLLCIFIISCGGGGKKDFVYIPETVKQRISSSEFVLIKNQEELNAEVKESNMGAAGGLLFSLIDVAVINSRANEAEKLLAPIRNELIDFDMHKEIKQAVFPVIQATPWLHAKDITIISGKYQDIVNRTLKDKTNKADVMGAINVCYNLDSNFNNLKVKTTLELYPLHIDLKIEKDDKKESKKQKQVTPIYRAKIEYNKKLTAATRKTSENAKLWAANNGQAIKVALKDSVANIALQLKDRLQNPGLDQNIKN